MKICQNDDISFRCSEHRYQHGSEIKEKDYLSILLS